LAEALGSFYGNRGVELIEFERPRKITFRAHSEIVDFDDAVELTETEGTTCYRHGCKQPRAASCGSLHH
jgi:Ni,Fe-hydrogenase I small subunit